MTPDPLEHPMRRTLPTLLFTGLLSAGVALPAVAGPPERTTIYDVASNSSDFDVLTAAVDALGLAAALDGNRQFTVFAPTDAAFLALPFVTSEGAAVQQLVDALGLEAVRDVVLYHVAPGDRPAADVISSTQVNTLLKGEKIPVGVRCGPAPRRGHLRHQHRRGQRRDPRDRRGHAAVLRRLTTHRPRATTHLTRASRTGHATPTGPRRATGF